MTLNKSVKNAIVFLTVLVHLLISSTFMTCQLPAQAVVPTTNSTSPATGDGVTNTFTFTFELLQSSDMTVYVNTVLQTQSVAYIVNPAGGSYPCNGGTITFQSGFTPINTAAILMARQLTLTQTISLPVEGSLPSSTLQTVFDRACMQIQQISTSQSLSLQLPITSVGSVNTALPTPVALNVIGWDSGAMNVVNYTPQQIVANVGGIGSGNVVGPATSVIGHLATFNNATGTLLSDLAPSTTGNIATSNGSIWTSAAPPSLGYSQVRLYTVTAQPEADGSVSGNATVYVGPYKGSLVTEDNGSGVLSTIKLTEISTSIAGLLISTAYSVYLFSNAGTQTVEIDQDWTTPTTPPTYSADALGRRTRSGATNKLLIGAFYCSAAGKTNDWTGERSVSNEYNEIFKAGYCQDGSSSWTYASSTPRASNASTTNGVGRFSFFSVKANKSINVTHFGALSIAGSFGNIGLGITSTTVPSVMATAQPFTSGALTTLSCSYATVLPVGLGFAQRMEWTNGATDTYYGTGSSGGLQQANGMSGGIFN